MSNVNDPAPFTVGELPDKLPELKERVEAAAEAGDPSAEAAAREFYGGALYGTGQVDAGIAQLTSAVALYRQGTDQAALGRCLMRFTRLLRGAGKTGQAREPARQALELLTEHGTLAERIEASMEVASVLSARAQLPQALAVLDEVREALPAADALVEEDTDGALRRLYPTFMRDLAVCCQATGAWSSAVEAWGLLADWLDAAGDPLEAMMARYAMAPMLEQAGQVKEALEVYGRIISESRTHGVGRVEAQCYTALSSFALKEEMLDKAVEWATHARAMALELVEPLTYVQATTVLAECYDRQGLRTRAFELLLAARSLLEDTMSKDAADGYLLVLEEGFRRRWGAGTWDLLQQQRKNRSN